MLIDLLAGEAVVHCLRLTSASISEHLQPPASGNSKDDDKKKMEAIEESLKKSGINKDNAKKVRLLDHCNTATAAVMAGWPNW